MQGIVQVVQMPLHSSLAEMEEEAELRNSLLVMEEMEARNMNTALQRSGQLVTHTTGKQLPVNTQVK